MFTARKQNRVLKYQVFFNDGKNIATQNLEDAYELCKKHQDVDPCIVYKVNAYDIRTEVYVQTPAWRRWLRTLFWW